MPDFKIEIGIPIPPEPEPKKAKYPFAEMEVGDSFRFLGKLKVSVRQAATLYAHRDGSRKEFVVQPEGDDYRIWRTK